MKRNIKILLLLLNFLVFYFPTLFISLKFLIYIIPSPAVQTTIQLFYRCMLDAVLNNWKFEIVVFYSRVVFNSYKLLRLNWLEVYVWEDTLPTQ